MGNHLSRLGLLTHTMINLPPFSGCWENQAGECWHLPAKGSPNKGWLFPSYREESGAHLFKWLMQNHTLTKKKNQASSLSLPPPGPAITSGEPVAIRGGAAYFYIKWPRQLCFCSFSCSSPHDEACQCHSLMTLVRSDDRLFWPSVSIFVCEVSFQRQWFCSVFHCWNNWHHCLLYKLALGTLCQAVCREP